MSTISDYEQSQLDAAMSTQLDAHQTALVAAIEDSRCLKCGYELRNKVSERAIRFVCGDPECGWSVVYPIAVVGNSSKEYGRGWREGYVAGQSNALAATNAMVEVWHG